MRITRTRAEWPLGLAVFAGAFAMLWSFEPLTRPLVLDPATWDYMSLALGEGRVPYRDIFLHKTPGGLLLGAAGVAVAPLLGVTRIEGAHLAFLALGAGGVALLYVLCRARMPIALALAAAVFMLAFDQWPVAALEGVRPKVATTTLGLACLVAASRQRWLSAGAFGGAAVLCWQPGLCFLLGAAWCAWRQGTSRARVLTYIAAGAALPAAALIGWLAALGAADDFWRQAVVFNLDYIRTGARPPGQTIAHLVKQLRIWNASEAVLLVVAAVGLVRSRELLDEGLAVSGAGYLALTFVSFQAWPDTILFAPVVAATLAAGLAAAARSFAPPRVIAAAVVAIALACVLTPRSSRLRPPIDFATQARFIDELAASLDVDDGVLVVGLPEFLLHTGRHSVWPWPYLWFGVDRFAAAHTDGGFEALLAGLDENPPGLILLARRWRGPLRQRFDQWAATRYRREQVWFYPHTVRPINVYRRLAVEDRDVFR